MLKNGRLYYFRVAGGSGEMHLVAPDQLMLSEGDVTITYRRDKHKRVVGLEYQWSLAPGPKFAAKIK